MREMRDSGVPWIGEMPKEWNKYRIKYNTFLKGRIGWQGLNSSDFLDEGYCLITGTDFDNKGGIHWETCYRISKERFDEDELLHIREGDLLMTKDGTVGKMAFIRSLPEEASLNSHLLIIRQTTDIMSNEFLYWMMLSDVFKRFCLLYQSGSIMNSIGQSTLQFFSCPCPPKKEQRRIAEFLDVKCAEIDTILDNTRTSIEEYKKLKQSVITEAVTKGIRGNRTMKDSGLELIGEMPVGWEYNRLKFLFTLHRGYDLANDLFIEEGGIPVYGSGGFMGYHDTIKAKSPNIVIGRSGSTGKLHFIVSDFWPHNTGIYVSDFKGNNEKYVYYILSALDMAALSTQTAVPTLDRKKIQESFFVFTLDTDEQQEIAAYLDEKCAAIDSLIASKEALITELESYKKSLIYEYVTGKKEVI